MGSESDMMNTDIVLNEKKIKKTHPGMRSCVVLSWHPSITTTKKIPNRIAASHTWPPCIDKTYKPSGRGFVYHRHTERNTVIISYST